MPNIEPPKLQPPSQMVDITLIKEKLHVAARHVGDALGDHPQVSSVLVFGSVASGHVDEYSDVDMLVICRSEILSVDERKRLLSQVGENWHFDAPKNRSDLFPALDEGGKVKAVTVEVHYQIDSWVSEVLDAVIGDGAITAEKLRFRPYTLPALLQRAWVLSDKEGLVKKWRDRASIFPERLKVNILQHFVPILQDNVEELKLDSRRRLGPSVFLFHLNQAVDALYGILLALNEVYDPADRRAERTVLPTLGHVPKDFMSRLVQILEGPFDDVGASRRANLFEGLAAEVFGLAEGVVRGR